jgi:hypothetical protein
METTIGSSSVPGLAGSLTMVLVTRQPLHLLEKI